ncbi:MAG: gamma-glutamyltranspeptidase / glutathione hydrolase, partial [Thermoleophilaceae bacterium]|nr:gamma-glutamyltranspeptidase / glutathione hydrolase [Thermoleophilaceae bacterium]
MRKLALLLLLLALAVLPAVSSAKEGSRFRPAVQTRLGVVATESPAAAVVGRDVLERGGNAADAAAATVFALNVARPQSCGIGGGGFAVYRQANGRVTSIDFREIAPGTFTPQTLQGPGLHKTFTGHLTVGVPGTLAGVDLLLRRYGTRSLAESIAPAARLARRGVEVTGSLSAAMAANAGRLKLFPAAAGQFLLDGQPYPAGSILRQPDLARSLELIARQGTRAFYGGEIARRIEADMATASQREGDAAELRLSDFRAYRAKERRPVIGSYRGRTIVSVPPPSSGGTTLLEMLNILSGYDLASLGPSSADELHLVAEAQKLAWADRNAYVADPDFVNVPTAGLISPRYGAERRSLIDPAHAQTYTKGTPPGTAGASPRAGASPGDSHPQASTTHISIIDARGNAIALTCTIEQEFGSAVVAPGTGFLLNNELTDFGDPGTANEAGPYKRPRSSMAPTIVVQRRAPVLVVGGAGGARIIMGVVDAVLNVTDFGYDVAHAVDAERTDDPTGTMTIEDLRVGAD